MPCSKGSSSTMRCLTATDSATIRLSWLRSGLRMSNVSSSVHICSLLMSPCLIISAYPEHRLSLSMVLRNSVSSITASALLNTPISFFSPPKFIPVFPPTDASTIESSVVGMFINFTPLLNVDAAKPPRSVTMPPPRFTKSECRVAPPFCISCHT